MSTRLIAATMYLLMSCSSSRASTADAEANNIGRPLLCEVPLAVALKRGTPDYIESMVEDAATMWNLAAGRVVIDFAFYVSAWSLNTDYVTIGVRAPGDGKIYNEHITDGHGVSAISHGTDAAGRAVMFVRLDSGCLTSAMVALHVDETTRPRLAMISIRYALGRLLGLHDSPFGVMSGDNTGSGEPAAEQTEWLRRVYAPDKQ